MKKNIHIKSFFELFSKGVLINLFLVLMLLLSFEGHATHYRYGNISWSRVNTSTRTVTVTVTQAWRRSFFGPVVVGSVVGTSVVLNFGDGGTANINLTVTSVNLTEDWFYGTYTVSHTYAGALTSFTLSYNNCCRVSTLMNNADGNFSSQSLVRLVNGNTGSPISSTPPIINLPIGQAAAAFNIPSNDPDGGTLTYGLATVAQTSATNPAGLAINATGNATFNTVGKLVGQLWQGAFVVTDSFGSNTIVDFMMLMVAANTPPVFDYNITPANNAVFNINPGQNISFGIKALDVDVGSTVTLSAVGLPTTNYTFSPSLPTTANPVTTNFSFTPSGSQLGIYIITFTATRNGGVQTSTNLTINVNTNPQFISPTKLEATNYVILSGVLNVDTISAQNPDPSVNTRITSGTIPTGATMAPSLPTAFSTTPTTQMSWTPTPADFGANNVSFLATDANGRTATRSYVLEVNTVPVFAPKSTDTVFPCVLYSYNIAVTDPDIPYGDDVEILADSVLPSWLTLTHNGNGTATLSGTPSNTDAGTYAISLAAEDLYHHVTGIPTLSFNITVLPDTTPPVTPNLADYIGGECSATLPTPTTTDNCSTNITVSTTTSFPITAQGTTVVTWIFDDGNGNSITADQNVIVNDVTPPNVTTTANSLNADLDCSDASGLLDALVLAPSATDNCGGTPTLHLVSDNTFNNSTLPQLCANEYIRERTWNFTDAANNPSANFVQTIHVKDITPPTMHTKNATVYLDATGNANVSVSDIDDGTTDNCGLLSFQLNKTSFNCSNLGVNNVILTATDSCGNSNQANAQVTVIDDLLPVAPVLPDVLLGECEGTPVAPTTTDNCAGVITGVTSLVGSIKAQGTTVVTWRFDDGNGNVTVAYQNFIINDVTLPTIACPSNITLNACQTTANWTAPLGSDNCSGLEVTQTAGSAPGSTFENGTTSTITYLATDAGGNQASCSFTVTRAPTLNLTVDNSNPQLYYGYTLDQSTVVKGTPSGGVAPYTVAITMNRILACNVLNSTGDEKWLPSAGTSTGSTCPSSGPGAIPVTTAAVTTGGNLSINLTLLSNATITVTVTDAMGCSVSRTTEVYSEDARCFAGSSGNTKVKICHRTGNASDPCHVICVAQEAVAAHLAHGDYLGACLPNCATPVVRKVVGFDVVAYPNPSKNNFTIEIVDNSGEKVTVEVYDMLSRLVKRIESDDSQPILFGDNLSSGTYITRVTQGENQKIIRVIKE